MQLLAAHPLEAAQRLMAPAGTTISRGQARQPESRDLRNDALHALTSRELEVLHWAASGKTAWETGLILSISEHTVNKPVAAAAAKLGCVGKAQAIARALRQGLLQ